MKNTANFFTYLQLLALLFGGLVIIACAGKSDAGEELESKTINCGEKDAIKCAFQDRDGNMWFGTNSHGLYRFNGKTFTNFNKGNGFYSNRVSAIIEDKEGNIWFGTDNGLCNYDGAHVFNQIVIPQSDTSSSWLDSVYPILNPNAISCLLQDSVGNMWLGTYGAGAYRYDCSTWTQFLHVEGRKQSDGLHHNWIESILEDRNGNIWFTSMTHGGISRFDGKSMTHMLIEDGLSDDMVRSSLQDRAGNIWFGTNGNRNGGLDRYNPETGEFYHFNQNNGLCMSDEDDRCYNGIGSIYEDKTGKIWLTTGLGKLATYDPSVSIEMNKSSFGPFVSKDGRSVNGIFFVMEDAAGNLWFGGKKGKLYRYNGDTLKDFTQIGNS